MRKQLLFAADAIERLKDQSRASRQQSRRQQQAAPSTSAPQTASA
jgi:hypothetical protein